MSGETTKTTRSEGETSQQEVEQEFDRDPFADALDRADEKANQPGDMENELEQLRQKVERQNQIVAESQEKVIRAQAELDNMRKRTARDVQNAHKYALEKFINELLPVLDSMELGIDATAGADDIESLREGMDLTLKKFSSTLEKFGVTVINPLNEKFNPERHEAVSMQEQDGVKSGTVISVMQKGYELNGRLVRPAMVIVAK